MLECLKEKRKFNLSVLDAIRLMSRIWNNISMNTIPNHIRKTSIAKPLKSDLTVNNNNFEDDNDVQLSQWNQTIDCCRRFSLYEMDEFIAIDDDLPTTKTLTAIVTRKQQFQLKQ